MGDFQSQTLRDTISTNWGLTGTIAKVGSETQGDIPVEIVEFTESGVPGTENRKAIEVRKLSPLENVFVHPQFEEVRDVFEITCRYSLAGIDRDLWRNAETDIEDMTVEVLRIVKTVYNPLTGTGVFFTTDQRWSNEDKLSEDRIQTLVRTLRLTMTYIRSRSTEVFSGYGGVLTFDVSGSDNMDSAPGGDYIYIEAYEVSIKEGTSVTEALTKDTVNGARVPKLGAGRFRGTFRARIMAKKSDIGSTAEKLNKIYVLQANGHHVEVAFLHDTDNTEGTPVTLTQSSFVKITSMEKVTSTEQLVKFNVEGRLTKPSTFATA